MMISCTAPGKLFLSGEYAVLDGVEAVITAVDRRAVARLTRKQTSSPVVEATRERIGRFLLTMDGLSKEVPRVSANSPNFRIRNKKVGLGSSAAVAAATTGVLMERAGMSIENNRSTIVNLATEAHRAAQGGKGSGGDVAVSVLGGTIVFSTGGIIDQINELSVELVAVWTGKPASTKKLVEQIDSFKDKEPTAYQTCYESLRVEAKQLADAYRKSDPRQIIAHTAAYGLAMGELGKKSGAPIVTSEHRLIANLAADAGGAAKPSGAGGGDVAIAVFENPDQAKNFRSKCIRFDLSPLELSFQAPGLRRE